MLPRSRSTGSFLRNRGWGRHTSRREGRSPMTARVEDPRIQKILDQIADPSTTERQVKLLEKKLRVLRGQSK